MTQDSLSLNILTLLRGNSFLTVSLPLAHKIGLLETIYLMDLLSKYEYHHKRNELTTIDGIDGYFYACIDDMQERTTMCRSTQDSCIKKLNLLGFVSHVVKGVPPRRFFKINIDRILEVFGVQIKSPNLLKQANQFAETDKSICQGQQIDMLKPANPIYRNTRSELLDQNEYNTKVASSPTPTANAEELMLYFFSTLKEKIPDTKPPNMKAWTQEMDKLLRIDNRSFEEAKALIDYIRNSRSHKYILSPKSFRDKYEAQREHMRSDEVESRIRDNRETLVNAKQKYPDKFKNITFTKDYVYDPKSAKEISFNCKQESFLMQLKHLITGNSNGKT